MNELIGTIWSGLIIDENDSSYFVQKNGVTFNLDKSEGERQIGDMVEGFGYQNQKEQHRMTTNIPSVSQRHYDFAEVVATRRDLGAFVDIGLSDKDIVVSLDELPVMRELWPKKGDKLLVCLKTDEQGRLWASIAEDVNFIAMSKPAVKEDMHNKDVSGVIYRLKMVGSYLLTDDGYLGFIHPSERYEEPRLGQIIQGRVIGTSPEGTLNVSLKPRSHEVISSDADMILTFLERSTEGTIPFTDKSTPEDITQTFAISKGQFKRALGSLMKQGYIEQKDGKTILLKQREV